MQDHFPALLTLHKFLFLTVIHDLGFLSQAAQPVCAGPYIMRPAAPIVNSRFRDALGISAAKRLGRGVSREVVIVCAMLG